MSKQEIPSVLSPETALMILNKTLEELQSPENVQKLEDARDNVGNEMLKMMQYLFPIVMQAQMNVIKEFGFPESREGIVRFAQLLTNIEREDTEVARIHSLLKAYYLPPVSVNATNESPEEKLSS